MAIFFRRRRCSVTVPHLESLPYICGLSVDEFLADNDDDFVGKKVEELIARIAQKPKGRRYSR